MKKITFLAILMAFVLVSCNQKSKEITTDGPQLIGKDSIMMDDKTKTTDNPEKMYACPMHPEVQGKLNEKCSKCGMKLTEPVPEKTEESK